MTPATPPAQRPRSPARFLLPLLGATWGVAVPALVVAAFGQSLAFLGESPSAAEVAATERLLQVAAVVAVALPVLGLVVAAAASSRAGGWTFAVLLVVGVGFALLVGWDSHVRHRDDVPPPSPVTGCQEHSGGGTRCPGG